MMKNNMFLNDQEIVFFTGQLRILIHTVKNRRKKHKKQPEDTLRNWRKNRKKQRKKTGKTGRNGKKQSVLELKGFTFKKT